ncbi:MULTISPECIES: hypothetical protein [Anoxybacillaceae]|nr:MULTISPECIES: hypothetical protein [Anoxybacillus]MBB3909104.1 hypothetical protein [Anoxybacillus rupiensis]
MKNTRRKKTKEASKQTAWEKLREQMAKKIASRQQHSRHTNSSLR